MAEIEVLAAGGVDRSVGLSDYQLSGAPTSGEGVRKRRGRPARIPATAMAETVMMTPEIEVLAAGGGDRSVGLSDYQLVGAQTSDGGVKKRRGRPARNPAVATADTAVVAAAAVARKRCKKVKEDEDVCFICFDGGSLVLCDHRDCPKAYHPACVKRDESFFLPDIRWDCGWHFCNICQKSALFMCYTCPYSLCKGCVKQADILCVRGNKGFCRTCMSTIMLLEKIPLENKELAPVDFDDTTSWEYLFKVYWIYLKEKEALTLDELTRASNPWKVRELKKKAAFQQKACDTYFSSSCLHLEANSLKRRKIRTPQQPLIMDSEKVDKTASNKVSGLLGQPDWASKELLEFVSYIKNGEMSSVSEFDVQTLLLDYIKNHSLRDPRQKCQIICDKRLEKLFGKERVGHFEMLRLLEYHFIEGSSTNSVIRGAAMNPLSGVMKDGVTVDTQTPCRDTRQQSRRKKDDRGRQNNLDAYAAIDAHNISLIYLKRGLLETLMVDAEKFHDKVVGSIVRIKLLSDDQKQDMHRLVRIIGTSKATKLRESGDQKENLMLKILNLNKVEDIKVDAISEREFSEDECRRLRQSIKLGLVERMTVGEIQEKAMALQEARVSNWIETEIRKLNHLRDQANERGHLKKHRDFVEKIVLLSTPEERQRRIHSIPEVHSDPRMDPSYGSDDSRESDMKRRDGHLSSPGIVGDMSKGDRARTSKAAAANEEFKMTDSKKIDTSYVEDGLESIKPAWKTERADTATRVLEPDSRTDPSIVSGNHGVATICSSTQANSNPSKETSREMSVVSDIGELEKIWHYQDPSGKIQGPFCIFQLRKWDSNGCFPIDLKVWRSNETCRQSILLNDALKMQQSSDGAKIDDEEVYSTGVMNSNSVTCGMSNQPNEECSKSNLTDTASVPEAIEHSMNGHSNGPNSDGLGDRGQSSIQVLKAQLIESLFNIEEPSSDSTVEGSPEMMHVNLKAESRHLSNAMSESDNIAAESRAVKIGPPSPDADVLHSQTSLHIGSEGTEASGLLGSMPDSDHGNVKGKNYHNRPDKHFTVNSIEQNSGVDSTVSGGKVDNDGTKSEDAENVHSISLNVPGGDLGTHKSTVSCGMDVSRLPTSMLNNEEIKANIVENKLFTAFSVPELEYSTSRNPETDCVRTPITESQNIPTPDVPGQDSGTSWNNIFGGELHLPNVASEWGWQPIELDTLGDESVSDLLSEVEAMESLRGVLSPNSRVKYADDSIAFLGDECFSPLDGLSLNLDLRINDSLSFAADMHAHQHYST